MTEAAEPKPVAVIELDAFCERCGFNLRSQQVWRDDRLGLLVCRCPECGQHQAATGRATMVLPWLHRAAMLATLAWVTLGLAFVAALLFGLFGTQVAATEGFTNRWMLAPDGAPVTYGGYDNGRQRLVLVSDAAKILTPGPVTITRTPVSWLGGPDISGNMYNREIPWGAAAVLTAIAIAGLYVAGAILASATWFWRPGRRWAWLVLPPLVAIAVAGLLLSSEEGSYFLTDYTPTYDRRLELAVVGLACAAQMAVLAIGLTTGRTLARWVLLLFAPPGVRQLFAFLWHCDGKTMPPARARHE